MHNIRPDEARSLFQPARVDASGTDFSNSIASRRKSYRTFTRDSRRRDVLGDLSDEEDEDGEENLERKLARLRRETELLKQRLEDKKKEKEDEAQDAQPEAAGRYGLENDVVELSKTLDNLHTSTRSIPGTSSAEEFLLKKIAKGVKSDNTVDAQSEQDESAPTSLPGGGIPAGLLSHAASFDQRLALVEAAIGLSKTNGSINSAEEMGPQPILPTILQLSSQLSTLSSVLTGPTASVPNSTSTPAQSSTATTPHIEALTTRIRKLTADADALSAARRRATEAARAALAARIAAAATDDHFSTAVAGGGEGGAAGVGGGGGNGVNGNANAIDVPMLSSSSALEAESATAEQAAKVQALYATLPTITSLHPLLPSVLERLRSLRALHAGAAHASEDLTALESRQAEMKREIDMWRQGLETIEKKVEESEDIMKGNIEVMKPWIGELEEKVDRLQKQQT